METKICTICKQEKNITEFHKTKRTKDGYEYRCKECRKILFNKYYNKNKKEIFLRRAIKNPLKVLIYSRLKYARKLNLPCDSINDLYNYLKPIYDQGECECCHCKLESGITKGIGMKDNTHSIDKIIPEKGYIVGNVAILCWKCNRLKSNFNFNDYLNIMTWLENK